ncbi:hypothetical protein E2542_SST24007 [Spatholobus suberectus]|nr:hypothetical protein E2542_SST24007 [Spatholobus suberectus]
MQQANRPSVQVPATPLHVIATQPVLVPSVLNGRHVSREDQQKRRQRTQLVDPIVFLNLHPPLYPPAVPVPPPPHQIYHHHPGIEVARPPPRERAAEPRVRPKRRSKILCEVGVAVFGGTDGSRTQAGSPQFRNVIHHDQIGIQVYHSPHAALEKIGEVIPRVVEWLFQGLPHGGGDQVAHDFRIEVIDLELQLREGGFDEGFQIGLRDEEVEEDVLRALGVLEDGVDGGDGAAEVFDVEGDGHVDQGRVADAGVLGDGASIGGAFVGIAEWRGSAEGESRGLEREAEEAVEVGGADGFGGVEGLEGRERRMRSIAAEKNPENLMSHSIFTRRNQNPLVLFFFLLVELKSARMEESVARVAFMSASVGMGPFLNWSEDAVGTKRERREKTTERNLC